MKDEGWKKLRSSSLVSRPLIILNDKEDKLQKQKSIKETETTETHLGQRTNDKQDSRNQGSGLWVKIKALCM